MTIWSQAHQQVAPVFKEVPIEAYREAGVPLEAGPRRSQLYWKLDPIIKRVTMRSQAHWKAGVSLDAGPRWSSLYWKLDPIVKSDNAEPSTSKSRCIPRDRPEVEPTVLETRPDHQGSENSEPSTPGSGRSPQGSDKAKLRAPASDHHLLGGYKAEPSAPARADKSGQSKLQGRWTSDEHDAYTRAFEIHGNNWEKVAAVVGTRNVRSETVYPHKCMRRNANKAPSKKERKDTTIEERNGAQGNRQAATDKARAKLLHLCRWVCVQREKLYNALLLA